MALPGRRISDLCNGNHITQKEPAKNRDEEAKPFFEERYAEPYRHKQGYQYAICLRRDHISIGYININADESHDLGYGLQADFWNKGIVTEAGKALLEAAKSDGIPYITATHDRDNPQSGRVMQKLGMKYQYSYEEQWQPKNKLVTFRLYQLNLDGNAGRVYRKSRAELLPKHPCSHQKTEHLLSIFLRLCYNICRYYTAPRKPPHYGIHGGSYDTGNKTIKSEGNESRRLSRFVRHLTG